MILTGRGWPHFMAGVDQAAVAARLSGLSLEAPAGNGVWVTWIACSRNYDQGGAGTEVQVRPALMYAAAVTGTTFNEGAALTAVSVGEPNAQAAGAVVSPGDSANLLTLGLPRYGITYLSLRRPVYVPPTDFFFLLNPTVNELCRVAIGWVEPLA